MISPEQIKYIIVVTFFLWQADYKHRFYFPDIIRLAQAVIRESLATRCNIVNASGYRLHCYSETCQAFGCLASPVFFPLLLLRYSCVITEIQNVVSCQFRNCTELCKGCKNRTLPEVQPHDRKLSWHYWLDVGYAGIRIEEAICRRGMRIFFLKTFIFENSRLHPRIGAWMKSQHLPRSQPKFCRGFEAETTVSTTLNPTNPAAVSKP